jgi:hypothetical protein
LVSPENQVTLGGYYGGHPPPKMVPFFAKIRKHAKVRLDLSLGQIQAEREQPSRKDARAGESLRLQHDTTLLPFLWTSGPLVKLNLSSSNSLRQRKRTTEQRDKRNKKALLRFTKCFKQVAVHYTTTWPEY